jgi:hypothetical protein
MRGIAVISFSCCLLSLNASNAYIKERMECYHRRTITTWSRGSMMISFLFDPTMMNTTGDEFGWRRKKLLQL